MPVTDPSPADLVAAHLTGPAVSGGWQPAAPWARPSDYDADRHARRTYLLLAAHHPAFAARAGRTSLAVGRRLGAPTVEDAAAVGLAHLATHIAARDLAARLTEAFPDDDTLPGLLEQTVLALWPAPGRAARPGERAYDAGHRLRAHLTALGYLGDGRLLTRTADQLTGLAAATGGDAPYGAWAGALVAGMVQHWTESPAVGVPERTDRIHGAAEPALLP